MGIFMVWRYLQDCCKFPPQKNARQTGGLARNEQFGFERQGATDADALFFRSPENSWARRARRALSLIPFGICSFRAIAPNVAADAVK